MRFSLLVLFATLPRLLGAQTVVPIQEEPRHRLAYDAPALRVLDIRIPPRDTTLFHRHDAPIAYVFVSPVPTNAQVLGEEWEDAARDTVPLPDVGHVVFNEVYPTAPREHRVACVGTVPFRLIGILNRGPGQMASRGVPLGTAGPAEAEGRWFRSAHHTLASGGTWIMAGHSRPLVVVQVSPGSVAVRPDSGSPRELRGLGDFVVLEPDVRAQLRNAGAEPVALAIVEVR